MFNSIRVVKGKTTRKRPLSEKENKNKVIVT
jgi:hypothetical protein